METLERRPVRKAQPITKPPFHLLNNTEAYSVDY